MASEPYRQPTTRPAPRDFSVFVGGPLYHFLRRAHLSGDKLEFIRERILLLVGLTWLPLLVLSIVEGHAWRGTASVPFLFDIEAHIRFLVALPLLIVAELIVHGRMQPILRQFLGRGLIPQAARSRFDAAAESAVRLGNSVVAEVCLIGLVYTVGVMTIWRHFIALPTTGTWYAVPTTAGTQLSLTGIWYAYVSLPIFQFLLVRWYWRIAIWLRFLWQVSRTRLSLIPTHPDHVGGLGFLAQTADAFAPLAVAHGAMLAGPVANRIFYTGARLLDFEVEIVALVVFVMCVVFGPLLVFALQLAAAKRTGLTEYGVLAERYVRTFDEKWLRDDTGRHEPLIGSSDIQSLADLANSFEVVETMRLAPVSRESILRLIVATVAPVIPLALTVMPLEDLLNKLFGLIF
jgi:hypothetical protein